MFFLKCGLAEFKVKKADNKVIKTHFGDLMFLNAEETEKLLHRIENYAREDDAMGILRIFFNEQVARDRFEGKYLSDV